MLMLLRRVRAPHLEQLPARVEVFQALQVGGRQLDVVRPERGRQLVHVRHVVLDGGDLVLELLQGGGMGGGGVSGVSFSLIQAK